MVPQVLELDNEFFTELVVDGRDRQGAGLVGEERAIISALEVELQICQTKVTNSYVGLCLFTRVNCVHYILMFYLLEFRTAPS